VPSLTVISTDQIKELNKIIEDKSSMNHTSKDASDSQVLVRLYNPDLLVCVENGESNGDATICNVNPSYEEMKPFADESIKYG
jgi:hypothetical protein